MTDGSRPIYLDHNATTPVHPVVLDAMLPWLRDGFANPSSDHREGRRARRAIDEARQQVAGLVGAPEGAVLFTSGGTESNNLAIFGSLRARPERRHVVTSTIEHPAVVKPCEYLEAHGHPVTWVPVGANGRVSPEQARQAVRDDTALVTIMLANNETGAIQPIRELAEAAHDAGAVLHTDAAQAVGKTPVAIDPLGADLLTIAGHKLYAPKGIGALVVRPGTPLMPLMLGANHEGGLRPGTENVASIVALGRACALAASDLADEAARQRTLTERLWRALEVGVPGLVRTVPAQDALPNTLHVRLPDVVGAKVLARAPTVAASTGSACHAGVHQPSDVLLAMGIEAEDALGALRLSVGRSTTIDAVDRAAAALLVAHEALAAAR